MAESSSKKETIIRRNERKGAQEWIGALALIRSLIVWRLSARKISGSWRFVMRRVLEGGVGIVRGGMVERSRDIGVRDSREEGREERGDEVSDDILFVVICSDLEMLVETEGRFWRSDVVVVKVGGKSFVLFRSMRYGELGPPFATQGCASKTGIQSLLFRLGQNSFQRIGLSH